MSMPVITSRAWCSIEDNGVPPGDSSYGLSRAREFGGSLLCLVATLAANAPCGAWRYRLGPGPCGGARTAEALWPQPVPRPAGALASSAVPAPFPQPVGVDPDRGERGLG